MPTNSAHRLVAGLLAAGALLAIQLPARASEEFPAALQEVTGMPCVPTCTVCHGKTPGDIGSFQARALPRALVIQGQPGLGPNNTAWLKASYNSYAAKAATDPMIKAVVDDLHNGVDPETKASLCGPTYGCAVHVAKKAPTRDFAGPLWVVGAMVVGGLLRRRKPAR